MNDFKKLLLFSVVANIMHFESDDICTMIVGYEVRSDVRSSESSENSLIKTPG